MPDLRTFPTSTTSEVLTIVDKYDGSVIGELREHSVQEARAIIATAAGTAQTPPLPRHERARILDDASRLLEARAAHAAELVVREAGKTIRQARKEVARAVNTLRLAAAEAGRNVGEMLPLDAFEGAAGRVGWYSREPLGVIVAITPYNDPLNLVAHKLGPAIAGGNTIILKPSQLTPLTAHFLADLLFEAGLPEERLAIVRGDRLVAQEIVSSRQVRMVSFTGGFRTAEAIAAIAGIKRLSMELGGNAPVLVFEDADLDAAIESTVSGAFWAAGQNCIGAQRILIARPIFDAFARGFVDAAQRLVVGDPHDEATDVGPMISTAAAASARASIDEAIEQGATLLTGGALRGSFLTPAVLTDVPRTCAVWKDEAFSPIVVLEPFDDEASAISAANDSEYALQAGLFTADIRRAIRVAGAIDAGGVMVNDSSDFRLDAMPFGGAKFGSMGREGVAFAYEEMTQPKVVVLT